MNTDVHDGSYLPEPASSAASIRFLISSLKNIVETGCEYEHSLDVVRLVNLLDLYRVYLQTIDNPENSDATSAEASNKAEPGASQQGGVASFEHFASSPELLTVSAIAASKEYRTTIAVPAPLRPSANS